MKGNEEVGVSGQRLARIGDHLEFCALTGNEGRGLDLIERHLPELNENASPGQAMWLRAAATLVLDRLTSLGQGAMPVRISTAEIQPADLLADRLRDQALQTAAEFDARNGTPARTNWILDRLAQQPIVEHLPLSGHLT